MITYNGLFCQLLFYFFECCIILLDISTSRIYKNHIEVRNKNDTEKVYDKEFKIQVHIFMLQIYATEYLILDFGELNRIAVIYWSLMVGQLKQIDMFITINPIVLSVPFFATSY